MSTLSDLEDAIAAHLATSEESDETSWPLVAWVLYTAQASPDGANISATGLHIPEGQPYYTTLGLLHSATNEADTYSVTWRTNDEEE